MPVKPVEQGLVKPELGPPSAEKIPIPVGLEECEGDCMKLHNGNVGVWLFHGPKGDAQWTLGNKATLIVERFDANGVIIQRQDQTTSRAAGQTGIYTGKLSNGRIDGVATLNWIGPDSQPMTKDIPWYATIPTTTCDRDTNAEDSMKFGTQAAAFHDDSAALSCFVIAANRGDNLAKALAGYMYRDGKGQGADYSPNYDKALVWLKGAAIGQDYYAQLALAQMYRLGLGLPKPDLDLARTWIHEAETNPKRLDEIENIKRLEQTQRLMFLGFTAILGSALRNM